MTEHDTSEPRTALDKTFVNLRGLGIRRRTDDKWIAGVCSGLADRLGVDPVIIRTALVVLSILGGFGVVLYLVAWALLPNDHEQIAAERALRDGDGGSIVLLVITAFALFAGPWRGHSDWSFPWGLLLTGVLVWWLIRRSGNRPDADRRVSAQQSGTPFGTATATPVPPSGTGATSSSATRELPISLDKGSAPISVTPARPVAPRTPRRRSGGARMALLALGLAIATYGSLSWLGDQLGWSGSHEAIALAGSLATMGVLLVGLGLAGWRAGFVVFLAFVLAIGAWSSTVVPPGIDVTGRVGDARWVPTSVVAGTTPAGYHLGVGDGVLDLSELPTEGLVTATNTPAKIPISVGIGELLVVVPEGLTVNVVGHVGLGEILAPNDKGDNGLGGSDVTRSVVVGDGPTEVVVDAEVGVGQLTVVKE